MKLTGKIVHGKGRGEGLGVPTLNLELQPDLEEGVYAVRILLEGKWYGGVMNFGPRPTFNESKKTLEVNVFNFEGDVYGEEAEIEVLDKLRDVMKFDSKENLVNQIKKDVSEAKRIVL
ncbi:riboflavin kinase [Patescibacteria group bacterium]|nr:riboflavin kinase [Patescibacteria group bacterium]